MIYKSISGLSVFKKINGEIIDKETIFNDLMKENIDSFKFHNNDSFHRLAHIESGTVQDPVFIGESHIACSA